MREERNPVNPAPEDPEGPNKRLHPRFAMAVRATVEMPFLPTTELGVCDLSRSGMFLAFADGTFARARRADNLVGPGAALSVSLHGRDRV